jgi:mRNA interferase RelE/StbE
MKQYQLDIPRPIRREIERLPGQYRQRIKQLLTDLTYNPRPRSAKKMRNFVDRYRIRVEQYRVVYRVEDDILLIEVLKVGKKEGAEFYEDLD